MTNIGGSREAKRRLVASVVHLKLLYAASVWASALDNHSIQNRLSSAQRGAAMRIISAYRTVSTSAALVLEIARVKEAIRKDARRDSKVGRPGDEHTVWYRSFPPGWRKSTVRSVFTWRKRFQDMAVSTRPWRAPRKKTKRRVAAAVPLWIMQSTILVCDF